MILQSHASYHRVPSSQKRSMLLTAIFGLTYMLWIITLGTLTGKWPYGLMEKKPLFEQTTIIGFGLILFVAMNRIGRIYHQYIWFEN